MANDLISREAVLNLATYMWDEYLGTIPCVPCEDIEKLPAVDAVEVVRCKDCKYHNKAPCPMKLSLNWTKDNGFCSYGERRE